jgi:hypothetical protein
LVSLLLLWIWIDILFCQVPSFLGLICPPLRRLLANQHIL